MFDIVAFHFQNSVRLSEKYQVRTVGSPSKISLLKTRGPYKAWIPRESAPQAEGLFLLFPQDQATWLGWEGEFRLWCSTCEFVHQRAIGIDLLQLFALGHIVAWQDHQDQVDGKLDFCRVFWHLSRWWTLCSPKKNSRLWSPWKIQKASTEKP